MSSGFTAINTNWPEPNPVPQTYRIPNSGPQDLSEADLKEQCIECNNHWDPKDRVVVGVSEYDPTTPKKPYVCGVCKKGRKDFRFTKTHGKKGLHEHLWNEHDVNLPGHLFKCPDPVCEYAGSPVVKDTAGGHIRSRLKHCNGRNYNFGQPLLVHVKPQLKPSEQLSCGHSWIPKRSWISHLAKAANVECRRKMGMNW